MALPPTRSCLRELDQGSVDGKYKQIIKDRGGVVEQGTWYARDELSSIYYDLIEVPVMDAPDTQKFVSPYRTATPFPDPHTDLSMAGVDYAVRL